MEIKTAISFTNVSAKYDQGQDILADVSFNLSEKSFCFLSGASGAGKTTLLKLIYQLHKQSTGHIKIFGKTTDELSRAEIHKLRSRMAIVFQGYSLLSHLSVFDNVALPLRVRGMSEALVKSRVTTALGWAGLAKYADSNPMALSGGQQQRVSVARAIITKPEILLADEPTGNLDDENATRLMDLFIQMNRAFGTTIILSTHNQKFMDTYKFPILRIENHKLHFIQNSEKQKTEADKNTDTKKINPEDFLGDLSKNFANIAGKK